jgi:hypothetical protein
LPGRGRGEDCCQPAEYRRECRPITLTRIAHRYQVAPST